jgi:hypothetical protein
LRAKAPAATVKTVRKSLERTIVTDATDKKILLGKQRECIARGVIEVEVLDDRQVFSCLDKRVTGENEGVIPSIAQVPTRKIDTLVACVKELGVFDIITWWIGENLVETKSICIAATAADWATSERRTTDNEVVDTTASGAGYAATSNACVATHEKANKNPFLVFDSNWQRKSIKDASRKRVSFSYGNISTENIEPGASITNTVLHTEVARSRERATELGRDGKSFVTQRTDAGLPGFCFGTILPASSPRGISGATKSITTRKSYARKIYTLEGLGDIFWSNFSSIASFVIS